MADPIFDKLTYVEDLTPDEVFEIWRANEERTEHWQPYWKEKGFSSWEEWRTPYRAAWNVDGRTWKLYEVVNPLQTVPQFRGGPYRSWKEQYYGGTATPRFSELAGSEALRALHEREGRITNFPARTTLTGIATEENIYIVEGMHRCASLAIAAAQGTPVTTKVLIALARDAETTIPEEVGGYEATA